jgi:hypothetical protein
MPKHKNNNETKSNILVAIAITLITVSIFGLLFTKPQNGKPYSLNIKGASVTKTFPFKSSSSTHGFNVLSSTTSALKKLIPPTETPTPTQETSFHHSKLGFSFNIPKNATVTETTPDNIILVANSGGGALIEIPELLKMEIGVVNLQNMNIFQYYHNRLATIFDNKIISFQDATESGSLKGYEVFLKNADTKEDKTLMFLGFKGNQIFEIEAVYLKKNHEEETQIFQTLISSLKPY